MVPRLFVAWPGPQAPWPQHFELPDSAARHAQVLRLRVGDEVELFDGRGQVWRAQLAGQGRAGTHVQVAGEVHCDTELPVKVTVALGMPANERMDTLVEKATELGMWRLQPLHCQRSVLRLDAQRSQRRQAHWQAVAQSAAAQCRRAWVPEVMPVMELSTWLAGGSPAPGGTAGEQRWLLSLEPSAQTMRGLAIPLGHLWLLSGPEGGFTAQEQAMAAQAGFQAVSLGPRVLRSDTAPLAALAGLATLI